MKHAARIAILAALTVAFAAPQSALAANAPATGKPSGAAKIVWGD
jgi:hypothetical protein